MLQAARPNAVLTFFVFLHLLERQAKRITESGLGKIPSIIRRMRTRLPTCWSIGFADFLTVDNFMSAPISAYMYPYIFANSRRIRCASEPLCRQPIGAGAEWKRSETEICRCCGASQGAATAAFGESCRRSGHAGASQHWFIAPSASCESAGNVGSECIPKIAASSNEPTASVLRSDKLEPRQNSKGLAQCRASDLPRVRRCT